MRLLLDDLGEEIDRMLPPTTLQLRSFGAEAGGGVGRRGSGGARIASFNYETQEYEANDGEEEGIYATPAHLASYRSTEFVKQDLVGKFLKAATWIFVTPHADSPSFVDNWLRCSTIST
jgi:hypothetical protein